MAASTACWHSLAKQARPRSPILLNVVHSLWALAWNPGLCLKSAGCEWRMCGLTTGPCARVQFEDPLPSGLCASASVIMDACMGWPVRDLEPLPKAADGACAGSLRWRRGRWLFLGFWCVRVSGLPKCPGRPSSGSLRRRAKFAKLRRHGLPSPRGRGQAPRPTSRS